MGLFFRHFCLPSDVRKCGWRPEFPANYPKTPESALWHVRRTSSPQGRRQSSGRARVTIEGKDYYLGKWGSPEADEAYRRIIAQWLAKDGPFRPVDDDPINVQELTAAYWLFAEKYYGYDKNPNRGDCANFKRTIAAIYRLNASLPVTQFGPLDLKAIAAAMVQLGWARTHVNHQIGRVKRIFKWGFRRK